MTEKSRTENRPLSSIKSMSKFEAVILAVLGLLLGTVFTFGMRYWQSPVMKTEAIYDEAVFTSYKETLSRYGNLKEILLRFEDREQVSVDSACLTDEVIAQIEAITPGTTLTLYVHPNSNTVLELTRHGEVILPFDETVKKVATEANAFAVLGIFMYLCAAAGILRLLKKQQ